MCVYACTLRYCIQFLVRDKKKKKNVQTRVSPRARGKASLVSIVIPQTHGVLRATISLKFDNISQIKRERKQRMYRARLRTVGLKLGCG